MSLQNLPFIENLEKRIQSASVLFDASLRNCFIDGLNNRESNVIYNCLRAYAATDKIKNAEEVFRTTIVAPFIHKVIAYEAYDGTLGDGLENDYRQIKLFVARDCKMLLEISSTGNSLKISALLCLFYITGKEVFVLHTFRRIIRNKMVVTYASWL